MNIIFVVSRAYHLLVADAYAQYIFNTYGLRCTIITFGFNAENYSADFGQVIKISDKHFGKKFCRAWQRLLYGGWLFPFSKIARNINCKKKSILFTFCDFDPIPTKLIRILKRKNRMNKVVLIEEGVGTYSITNQNAEKTFGRTTRHILSALLGAGIQCRAMGDNRDIDYVIVNDVEKYRALDKAASQIVLRQSKSTIFGDSFRFLDRFLDKAVRDTLETVKSDIVFLGEPVWGFGDLTSDECAFMEHIVGLFPANTKILIKPHPAEKKGKYTDFVRRFENVELVDERLNGVPIECLMGDVMHPQMTLSFYSSAGINIANTFPNIFSVFLYKLDSAKTLSETIPLENEVINDDVFVGPFHNIGVPNTDAELREMIAAHVSAEKTSTDNALQNGGYPEIDVVMQSLLDGGEQKA